MREYEIIPLHVGDIQVDPAMGSGLCEVPVIAYLIVGGEKPILVDTGMSAESADPVYAHDPFTVTSEQDIERQLSLHGVAIDDISTIINTHLHWDHYGNNCRFPKARIYIQQKELLAAVSPIPVRWGDYEYIPFGPLPVWIKSLRQYKVVDGDYQLDDGIWLIYTPGHTAGFQSVLVNTCQGMYLIAGDTVLVKKSWMAEPPIPSPNNVSLELYYESLYRMRTLCEKEHVLPGHDPEVFLFQKYPVR